MIGTMLALALAGDPPRTTSSQTLECKGPCYEEWASSNTFLTMTTTSPDLPPEATADPFLFCKVARIHVWITGGGASNDLTVSGANGVLRCPKVGPPVLTMTPKSH